MSVIVALAIGAGTVACGTTPPEGNEAPSSEAGAPQSLGGATPEASPASRHPAGEVIDLNGDLSAVSDTEELAIADGDVIALRSGAALAVGTVAELKDDAAHLVDIDPACGELSATGSTFVVACGDKVTLVEADTANAQDIDLDDEHPATTAALTTSGELYTANDQDNNVVHYAQVPGDNPEVIPVERGSTQLLSLPVSGQEKDALVRTQREDTTIQNIDLNNSEQGGRLRVGLGIGRIATAGDGSGIVLAADALGGQLAVFTSDDVIRLHQTHPVPADPWDVAWSNHDQLAWITSLGTNQVNGFDISAGVPEENAALDTIADPRSLGVLADGTLIVASATGDGLQIITDPRAHG